MRTEFLNNIWDTIISAAKYDIPMQGRSLRADDYKIKLLTNSEKSLKMLYVLCYQISAKI